MRTLLILISYFIFSACILCFSQDEKIKRLEIESVNQAGKHLKPKEVTTSYGFFHDRGLITTVDYDLTSGIVTDGAWHQLDISSIVPVDTKAALVRLNFLDDAAGSYFYIKNNTIDADINVSEVITQVSNISNNADVIVPVDYNRIMKYSATNTTWSNISVTIRGWWK